MKSQLASNSIKCVSWEPGKFMLAILTGIYPQQFTGINSDNCINEISLDAMHKEKATSSMKQ